MKRNVIQLGVSYWRALRVVLLFLFLLLLVPTQTLNLNFSLSTNVLELHDQTVVGSFLADSNSLIIENITVLPRYPMDRDKVTITAIIRSSTGIKAVSLRYSINQYFGEFHQINKNRGVYEWLLFPFNVDTVWNEKQMAVVEQVDGQYTFEVELIEQPYRSEVYFSVKASDSEDNSIVSNNYKYTVGYGVATLIHTFLSNATNYSLYLFIALILSRIPEKEDKKKK